MNYEKIKDLIAAGEKATQGAFSHSRKDMHTFCAYTGKQQSFIYPPEPSERITVETEYPVEDAQFFAKAANARDELKAMYDELMRLRELQTVVVTDREAIKQECVNAIMKGRNPEIRSTVYTIVSETINELLHTNYKIIKEVK